MHNGRRTLGRYQLGPRLGVGGMAEVYRAQARGADGFARDVALKVLLPDCRDDRSQACCHGLPRTLLDEYIRTLGDDTCCGALSADDLVELQQAGHCESTSPP